MSYTSGRIMSLIASFIITMLGFLFPVMFGNCLKRKGTGLRNKWFTWIVGFPAGAFLGNTLITLIPSIYKVNEKEGVSNQIESYKYSCCVMLGIAAFCCVENFTIKEVTKYKNNKK